MARYCSLSLPDEAYKRFLEDHILGQNEVTSENGVTTIGLSCDETDQARETIHIQSDIGEVNEYNVIDYLMNDCNVPFDFVAEPAVAGYEEGHGFNESYRPDAPEGLQHVAIQEDKPSIWAETIRETLAESKDAEEFKQKIWGMAELMLPTSSIQEASRKYNAEFNREQGDVQEDAPHLLPREVFDFMVKDIEKHGDSYGEWNGFEHDGVFYLLEADREDGCMLRLDAYTCGEDFALNMNVPGLEPSEGGFQRDVLDMELPSFDNLRYESIASIVDGAVVSFEQTHKNEIRKDKKLVKQMLKAQKHKDVGR